ncbi:alanine--tRNA ligase [Caulobacter rhizosphaerae]|jgi:alanyl-tRNA synthetase|uniref:alanine--tRNA ligase n=1 Tax=Caulobacter rhizosphaerae TaxID=2010972 RepID=UPI0013D6D72E|nr:alanine--tRNA ligase [Caulobacter rhizosphaerae]GGL46325.1 alanine--tRNA ligase [Caulobacter rhizosphaerae]
MPSLNEIRSTFLNYFGAADHAIVPSAPLVPQNDPTLLFVNAGMVPFKNVFTGAESPPHPRATSSQKCVRAGGKHNDLDNVGYTARHHTFFEMLGNFSFGDYFKEQAITHAWTLLTRDFALPKDKLLVTVYHTDDEAADLWKKIAGLDDSRIIRIPTNDNFWSMGDTGPCGPCSEIFFDHGEGIAGGPPGSPDEDGDRFIEIWNLVFMQFEQMAGGERVSLPKPSIDTGMGLERVAAVLQGVHDNYDIDLFKALIAASVELTGVKAQGDQAPSHRVIADHLRSSSFLLADGVTPSNEGRGYVLRRIMRRAMRHAYLLGAQEPLMHRLAPTLVAEMGQAYPELRRAEASIVETLRQEEERFRVTLGRGMGLLDEATANLAAGGVLDGETAFKLYDTYGFPLDLTQDAVRAKGITVDTDGFDVAMDRQRQMARANWAGSGQQGAAAAWFPIREANGPTSFVGYDTTETTGTVKAIVLDGAQVEAAQAGATVDVLLDRTSFYAESGGQAGDTGVIEAGGVESRVVDTQKQAGDLHVHRVELAGPLKVGDPVVASVDAAKRTTTRANHSAAHLVHAALHHVLGPHVAQKGQMVDGDRMRFDFSHGGPLTADEIERIEAEVNAVIRQNVPAQTKEMAPQEAIEAGAVALFGEKYGDSVRVLTLGESLTEAGKAYSVELCGGTHVARTGDIALFKIVSEQGVAAGVRRIEALTGEAARRFLLDQAGVAKALADQFKTPVAEVLARVDALVAERKALEKQLAEAKKQLALGGGSGGAASGPEDVNGTALIARVLDGVGGKELRGVAEEFKKQLTSGVVALVGTTDGKAAVTVAVTADLVGRFSAADLAKAAVIAMGGQGAGGKADFAQGGAPDASKAQNGLDAIKAALAG